MAVKLTPKLKEKAKKTDFERQTEGRLQPTSFSTDRWDYKGLKRHALFNWFVCAYFADDIYKRVTRFPFYVSSYAFV